MPGKEKLNQEIPLPPVVEEWENFGRNAVQQSDIRRTTGVG
jgi:hypothetical protein